MCNYSYKELKDFYEEEGMPTGYTLNQKKYKWFKKAVRDAASFVDNLKGEKKFDLYLKCVLNDIKEPPRCPSCGEPVKSVRKTEFSTYCSRKCMGQSTVDKRKETMISRYGVDHPMHSDEIRDKLKKTNLEKYGTEYTLSAKVVRNKIEETNIKEYGYKSFVQTDEAKVLRTNSSLEKYGTEHPSQSKEFQEKVKHTNLERYGHESYLHSEDGKERIKQINLEKYGTEYPSQNVEIKSKTRKTSLERYGVDHPMKSDEVRSRQRESILLKYGVEHIMHSDIAKDSLRKTFKKLYGSETTTQLPHVREGLYKFYENNPFNGIEEEKRNILLDKDMMESLYETLVTMTNVSNHIGVSVGVIRRAIDYHGIEVKKLSGTSAAEQIIHEWVRSLGFDTESNVRFDGNEIDVYIPEKRIGIEFNGLWWHSEEYKESSYHQKKALDLKDKGIRLIHIWEDDWINKRKLIETKIKTILGVSDSKRVFARKCTVDMDVDSKEAAEFMNSNHIQGFVMGTKWIGLRHGNELVACMGTRRTREGVYDLNRYATSCTVVGGFSKLLSAFKNASDWKEIYTFASLDYSNGDLYERTGFTKSHITKPQMFYVKGQKKFRRENFMKHKLKDKLDGYDSNLTERENMNNHGFVRLFDSGSIKFVMER